MDRIALLGKNGNGKSTLAKILAGQLILNSGKLIKLKKCKIGFFNQHQNEELPEIKTPIEYISHFITKSITEIRSYLAKFGLTANRAITQIKYLSGGEKTRLLLAKICLNEPQILILDEPTNHLDIQGRECLIEALNDFNGSVILITHDFHILESVCDTLWIVENHTCKKFNGDLQEYKNYLLNLTNTTKTNLVNKKEKSIVSKSNITKKIKQLEKQLDELHSKHNYLIQSLIEQKNINFAEIQKEISNIECQISKLENEWCLLVEEL